MARRQRKKVAFFSMASASSSPPNSSSSQSQSHPPSEIARGVPWPRRLLGGRIEDSEGSAKDVRE
jgi:hypothetical protein